MTKDTGGPAFPTEHITEVMGGDFKLPRKVTTKLQGMTLRDYLASAALCEVLKGVDYLASEVQAETRAEYAYEIADAMIAERSKNND